MLGNILVVEDEIAIQALLSLNLKQAGYQVRLAATGEGALQEVADQLPDLLIVDWMLPVMSGIDLVRQLKSKERTKRIPVVFLTAKTDEPAKLEGLGVGVDDYVTKPFSPKELIIRIKNILRRTSPDSIDEICEISGLKLDPVNRRVLGNDIILNLGPTEFKLLHFLMTHPDRVYSRVQLLNDVWGDHMFLEERTIDVHIRRLRRALEPAGLKKIIKTVRGAGYSLSTAEN